MYDLRSIDSTIPHTLLTLIVYKILYLLIIYCARIIITLQPQFFNLGRD